MDATITGKPSGPGEAAIPPDARAVLRIDLGALRANWAQLNAATGKAECAGVVKADAYGLGLEEIARALTTRRLPHVLRRLAGGRPPHARGAARRRDLRARRPAARRARLLRRLRPVAPCCRAWPRSSTGPRYCRQIKRRLPAAVHIDTGINRLGMPDAEVRRLARDPSVFEHFDLDLVMSHLACADEPGNPKNAAQQRQVRPACARCCRRRGRASPTPAAHSSGPSSTTTWCAPASRSTAAARSRAGRTPMQPVVRLSARILQVRDVAARRNRRLWRDLEGRQARPHRHHRLRLRRRLPARAERADRQAGPRRLHRRLPVPIVGRVSMDLITVDVTGVPDTLAHRGGWVEVIGDKVTVDDLTDIAGTIGYELLSRLSPPRASHLRRRMRQRPRNLPSDDSICSG